MSNNSLFRKGFKTRSRVYLVLSLLAAIIFFTAMSCNAQTFSCQALTKSSGYEKQCLNNAVKGSSFCARHQNATRVVKPNVKMAARATPGSIDDPGCQALTKGSGYDNRCRNKRVKGSNYCALHATSTHNIKNAQK